MEMEVHLHPDVFDIVSDGVKDIEVRVNDLKRRIFDCVEVRYGKGFRVLW